MWKIGTVEDYHDAMANIDEDGYMCESSKEGACWNVCWTCEVGLNWIELVVGWYTIIFY